MALKKAEDFRQQMEAASYTAWQLLSVKGHYKKGFKQYLSALGLGGRDDKKIDKEEKEQVVETVARIHSLLKNRSAKNAKS